ncbi:MAG TPA: fused MFS/spermidine synthase [Burkholderiales bacterium]|nr:fused MFS/spermidine synthase [Burkholderiales bacterium]
MAAKGPHPVLAGRRGRDELRWRDRTVLYATVTITGAAVMMLELLGTRVIGPFFGVSLYVWSALIAVTMIALALGYFLGGWCADRRPRIRLAHLVLLAALGTLAIIPLSGPVLAAADPFGVRAGALLGALALFLAPLTCLGMSGPYVVKLAARGVDGVGIAAGSVYAISTLGSVLGTLALGFYLLPILGTRRIVEGTGAVLLVLGLGLALYERQLLGRTQVATLAALVLAVLVALVAGVLSPVRVAEGFRVLHSAESMYGWVRVVDDERKGIRLLLSDASSIGAVDLRTGRTALAYQQILALLPLVARRAGPGAAPAEEGGALLIGLGVGYVATELDRQGLRTDAIEIDPAVAAAAIDFFGYRPAGRLILGDGRYEIRGLRQRYRLIIHDCFTGGAEPIHLLTRETFATLRSLLADGGVLAVNFVGFARGPGSEALAAVSTTLASVFPHRRVFVTRPGAEFSDYVFLASQAPIEFAPRDDADRAILAALAKLEIPPPQPVGVLLTDDFNPLEGMEVRKAELYRRLFMDRVSPALLLR